MKLTIRSILIDIISIGFISTNRFKFTQWRIIIIAWIIQTRKKMFDFSYSKSTYKDRYKSFGIYNWPLENSHMFLFRQNRVYVKDTLVLSDDHWYIHNNDNNYVLQLNVCVGHLQDIYVDLSQRENRYLKKTNRSDWHTMRNISWPLTTKF